jgi:hypothetical protein
MKKSTAITVILANLVALAVLTFVYPHLMIAPGPLIEAHRELTTDCFACHAAFRGSTATKCATCHKLADIGRLTTTGQPITDRKIHVPFHQNLIDQDCVACHSDHRGLQVYRAQNKFSHDLLNAATRERCEACHQKPADSLHAKISGNCLQCHQQDRWKPATFAHDKFFQLDKNHNSECVTCHTGNDFRRYTCYGCHEHAPATVQAQHAEEGIRNLDNCVECHRSAAGEGGREGGGEGGSKGRRGREDD